MLLGLLFFFHDYSLLPQNQYSLTHLHSHDFPFPFVTLLFPDPLLSISHCSLAHLSPLLCGLWPISSFPTCTSYLSFELFNPQPIEPPPPP
jgi:hypothetical protein